MHTSRNAKSVPMFVRSTVSSMVPMPEKNATTTPVRIVDLWGVRKRGCTDEKKDGRKPSRAIEKKMRGWPSWKTSKTAVDAMTDPRATTPTIQLGMATYLIAAVRG